MKINRLPKKEVSLSMLATYMECPIDGGGIEENTNIVVAFVRNQCRP